MPTIGNLVKISFVDWENNITSVIFIKGCNLRCEFCHNHEILCDDNVSTPSIQEVKSFLETRNHDIEGIVISGGEPLMNASIIPFITEIKNLTNLPIKIDTNGCYPETLNELINDKLIDYIAMDIKAPLKHYKKVCGVSVDTEKISKSIKLIMNCGIDYEFRTTLTPVFHDEKSIIAMAKLIAGAKVWYFQRISPHQSLQENFPKLRFTNTRLDYFINISKKYVEKVLVR